MAASENPEKWVDIEDFIGYYQVSDKGRIKSLARYVTSGGSSRYQPEQIMCHWCGITSLYDCVRLYKNGIRKKFSVHRLVAQHFLPTWNAGMEVNHIDGNRYNNAAANLEMCTRQENVRHAVMHMLKNDYGEKSSNAKLKNIQAREIRKKYRSGVKSQRELAQEYGVSAQTISAIIRYKKYIR